MYADPLNPTAEELAREDKALPRWASELVTDLRRLAGQAVHARDLALGRSKPEESAMVLAKRVYGPGPTREILIGLGDKPRIVVPGAWGAEFHITTTDRSLQISSHGDHGDGNLHVRHRASNSVEISNVRFVPYDPTNREQA